MFKDIKKIDLSPKAINLAVTRQTAQHPIVLYPAVIGVLGISAALLLDFGLMSWIIGIGGLATSILTFGINRGFRKEEFASEYMNVLFTELEKKRKDYTKQIQDVLSEVDSQEGITQFKRLADKFMTFNGMLKSKLRPGELTFSRYNAMAEQVYLGALDNLNDLANTMKGIQSIDEDYITKRLAELDNPNSSDHALKEVDALKIRLALLGKQRDKVDFYLSQNEDAMTKMDEAIVAITDLKTEDMRAEMDLEMAMSHLQEIAKRSKDYN